jgi:hypothetical protein
MNSKHGQPMRDSNTPSSSTWSARLQQKLVMLSWAGVTALLPQSSRAVSVTTARAELFRSMTASSK